MKNILVTGGAGFIGSHVVDFLVKKRLNVKVLDDLSTGNKENLSQSMEKITFVEGSILDNALLEREIRGMDGIVHLAAKRSVFESVEKPIEYNNTNINGTVNLLQAMRKNNVKRIVFASSSSVYGDSKSFPQTESDSPNPISPYALSKLSGEYYLKLYKTLFGMETISLRFFNVYGPRQDPKSQYANVIPVFIKAIVADKQPTIFGDGLQSRDFVYATDVAESCFTALRANAEKVSGETFNVGSGEGIKIIELVDYINRALGKDIRPKHSSALKGDVRHTLANIEKAKKLMGFKPRFSFEKGLKETIEFFKEH